MPVIPFDPDRHIIRSEPAHIDSASNFLLLAVLSDLVALRDSEPDHQRAEVLRATTCALCDVLERFEPPRGTA
ncbi:hypothetical protein D3C78_423980 [compost metagenome]